MRYFIFALLLCSCAEKATYLSSDKEGWFFLQDNGLAYCKANSGDKLVAHPSCAAATTFLPDEGYRKMKVQKPISE